jgi:hypothetical protein
MKHDVAVCLSLGAASFHKFLFCFYDDRCYRHQKLIRYVSFRSYAIAAMYYNSTLWKDMQGKAHSFIHSPVQKKTFKATLYDSVGYSSLSITPKLPVSLWKFSPF